MLGLSAFLFWVLLPRINKNGFWRFGVHATSIAILPRLLLQRRRTERKTNNCTWITQKSWNFTHAKHPAGGGKLVINQFTTRFASIELTSCSSRRHVGYKSSVKQRKPIYNLYSAGQETDYFRQNIIAPSNFISTNGPTAITHLLILRRSIPFIHVHKFVWFCHLLAEEDTCCDRHRLLSWSETNETVLFRFEVLPVVTMKVQSSGL
jgi:hypothetical protein